jgi:hypothetical protein
MIATLTPYGRAFLLRFRDLYLDLVCDGTHPHRTLAIRGPFDSACPVPTCSAERSEYDGDSMALLSGWDANAVKAARDAGLLDG